MTTQQDDQTNEADESGVYNIMQDADYMPAESILVQGKEMEFLVDLPAMFSNYACFAAETPVLTDHGIVRIGDLSGASHRIIDGNGDWTEAEFRSFGEQRIWNLAVFRGGLIWTIRTTGDHRWFVDETPSEVTTSQLRIGQRLARGGPRGEVTPDIESWIVIGAVETETIEEVFCAVVPTTGSFVLTGNLLTGNCIYGRGCQGTTPICGSAEEAPPEFSDPSVAGCCNTSPGLPKDDRNFKAVKKAVRELKPHEADNYEQIKEDWLSDDEVRLYEGRCIFLNGPEHENPGCSLWHHGISKGQRPQDVRPSVCHTEPLFIQQIGEATGDQKYGRWIITLRPYWFGFFHKDGYWCMSDPAAFAEKSPAYQTLAEQLQWLIQDDDDYATLKSALDETWEERRRRYKKSWGKPPVSLGMPKPALRLFGEDMESRTGAFAEKPEPRRN